MPYIPEHLATLQICEGCNGDKSTAMGKHNPEEKADIPRPNIPLQFILRKNAETMWPTVVAVGTLQTGKSGN